MDIAPTLLQLFGIEDIPEDMQGKCMPLKMAVA